MIWTEWHYNKARARAPKERDQVVSNGTGWSGTAAHARASEPLIHINLKDEATADEDGLGGQSASLSLTYDEAAALIASMLYYLDYQDQDRQRFDLGHARRERARALVEGWRCGC